MKQKTDDQIRRDVVRELLWDHRTSALDIRVNVNDGVVTLDGTVDSLAKKMAVERAAHRVAGVLDLADEIAVKAPHGHTDEKIAHAVRQALEWDAVVPDELITTTVSDGIVTLRGTVATVAERADAQWIVSCLAGVAGVINEIQVSDVAVNPDELRDSIEAALERRAEREADRIKVEVKDGEVSLFGRVHSWPERQAIVGVVGHARGVKQVHDYLVTNPYF
jgi:osmotically-inducible protein OsmY